VDQLLQMYTADLPGVRWVVLTGELDLFTANRLRRRVLGEAGGSPEVIFDLRGLGFCDLRGLQLLIDAQRRCARRGERFRLLASDAVRRAIGLGGLAQLEHAEASLDEALFRGSTPWVDPRGEVLASIRTVVESILASSERRETVVQEARTLRRAGEERRRASPPRALGLASVQADDPRDEQPAA